MNMRLQRIKEGSRAAVNTFIRQNWFDIKMEILSLNSLNEVKGIGSALLNAVQKEARNKGCKKIMLIATNDNTNEGISPLGLV